MTEKRDLYSVNQSKYGIKKYSKIMKIKLGKHNDDKIVN